MMRYGLVIVFACIMWSQSTRIAAQEFDIRPLQKQIFDTIETVTPAVVSIGVRGSEFSGVIVSKEGHVLSAGHTVRPGQTYRIQLPDGKRLSGRGLGSNDRLDCGLIKINNPVDLPFVQMGDSSKLLANQPCLSLSYPGGTQRGSLPIVRFGRIIRTSIGQNMIQSTALMEPGDSGGPLFDLNGRVIAIHSRIGRSMDRNLDVPVDTFKKNWDYLNQAKRFGDASRSLPKFGFEIEETENRDGLLVRSVTSDGLAKKSGLKADDIVTRIYGQRSSSVRRMRGALFAALDAGVQEIEFDVTRNGASRKIKLPFKTEAADKPPKVALPSTTVLPAIKPVPELARLAGIYSTLESKLDDPCVVVHSKFGSRRSEIFATMLADSNDLISKSSMIGNDPFIRIDGRQIKLSVVGRDYQNDLVLLRSPEANKTGIKLAAATSSAKRGRFLLTPDPQGDGLVSIRSSLEFSSAKRESKGFLGVRPINSEDGGALLTEVNAGAARDAGIKNGDVIIKMDDAEIENGRDVFEFMSKTDPNKTIAVTLLRDDKELEKTVTLGAYQSASNHAADMMEKSGRRDGFKRVFSHDADLQPQKCGGPIFDLEGNFVGLNIARNSRVRSFAIPLEDIRKFVEQHAN